MTEFTLVESKPDDDPFLFRVFAAARPELAAALGLEPASVDALLRMQFEAQKAGYRARFPRAAFQIIRRGSFPVGSVIIARGPDELRLVDIALLPEFRGQGLGSRILEDLKNEAASLALPLRLSVAKWNRALGLYHRLGFRQLADGDMHHTMEWTEAPPR